ncbi:MAG: DNA primase [Proteobacteria bacterium]|nr:MAG: DNA primase [Pseudomonadota bacterium]
MAGRIPQGFIDELLIRADIVEVIDARVPLTKGGKDFKARCPFHDEKTPSFTVSPDKQFYHCFGCQANGNAIGFLMEYEHMSFPEAVEELANHVGIPVPKEVVAGGRQFEDQQDLLDILQEAATHYQRQLRDHPQAQAAVDYLKGRGLSGEVAARFDFGFAPDGWDNLLRGLGTDDVRRKHLQRAGLLVAKDGGGYYDRFRNRIMFPIHDQRGRIVGFGGRVIGEGEPKYLNSPETPLFHKGREMYGLFLGRDAIRREQRVFVVEGYMDVVALAQHGVDFAVATLGTATTRDHLDRLFRFTSDVVFCFDGDRAGLQAAWRALEIALPTLDEGRQVSFLFLPEGEDPDSVIRREGAEAFLARQVESLPDYFFRNLHDRADVRRLDGRARMVELASPLLSKIPEGPFRQMMRDRLAEISGLEPQKLPRLGLATTNKVSPKSANRPRAELKKPPSLVRTAVALLLRDPSLAKQVKDPEAIVRLDLPGTTLLAAMLDILKIDPELNMAALIERFRDSEHRTHLEKLAVWTHPVLEQDAAAEFQGTLGQLEKAGREQRTDRLLYKERAKGLNQAEKAELGRLLAETGRSDAVTPTS